MESHDTNTHDSKVKKENGKEDHELSDQVVFANIFSLQSEVHSAQIVSKPRVAWHVLAGTSNDPRQSGNKCRAGRARVGKQMKSRVAV